MRAQESQEICKSHEIWHTIHKQKIRLVSNVSLWQCQVTDLVINRDCKRNDCL